MASLPEFLEKADQFDERLPLERLRRWLEELEISIEDVRDYVRFDTQRYRRNLLHAGPAYQALIICWRNGQRSPIHDHRGSSCGVKVLRGVMTETQFDWSANELLVPTITHELAEGGVCGSQDADIHQVSNLQAGEAELVTLHIYSPPLLTMGTYSLTDRKVGEFFDPVFEFADGAGI